jgi:hypothetical protein
MPYFVAITAAKALLLLFITVILSFLCCKLRTKAVVAVNILLYYKIHFLAIAARLPAGCSKRRCYGHGLVFFLIFFLLHFRCLLNLFLYIFRSTRFTTALQNT